MVAASNVGKPDIPKGWQKLFLLFCPSAPRFMQLPSLVQGASTVVVALAYLTAYLQFALVPLWLWFIRQSLRQGNQALAVVAAVLGFALLYLFNFVYNASTSGKSRTPVLKAQDVLNSYPKVRSVTPVLNTASNPRSVRSPEYKTASPNRPHAPAGDLTSMGHSIMHVEEHIWGEAKPIAPDMYGVRVSKLCAEVGVAYGNPKDIREIHARLLAVKQQLGLP